MSKFNQAFIVGIALSGLCAEVYAQASDVDCVKCVDPSDIAAEAVNSNKIKKHAVTTEKIAKQAVTSGKIAPGAVGNGKIKNGAITENKLSANLSNAMLGTRLPRVVDGGANLIGYLVNIDGQGISVLTEQGYILDSLALRDGDALYGGTLWFASADCTGTAYTDLPNGFVRLAYDAIGVEKLYYVDKNSVALSNLEIGSSTGAGGCFAIEFIMGSSWPVLPNVPSTTGFSSLPYPIPIKIEYTQ